MRISPRRSEFLGGQRVARLASENADGTIHLVPVCFAFDGRILFSTVISGSRRVRNIRREPRVSVLIDSYEEGKGQWKVLKGVLLYGKASLLSYGSHRGRFMHGWKLLIEKYPQYRRWAGRDLIPTDIKKRRIMAFEPRKAVEWGFRVASEEGAARESCS